MNDRPFTPGFRLSFFDATILVVGVAATWMLTSRDDFLAFVVGCAVSHFFLFCNVFRISRKPELIWATCFVGLSLAHRSLGLPTRPWLGTMVFALAILLIIREMRQPGYHGVFWKTVNPNLPAWWKNQS